MVAPFLELFATLRVYDASTQPVTEQRTEMEMAQQRFGEGPRTS